MYDIHTGPDLYIADYLSKKNHIENKVKEIRGIK